MTRLATAGSMPSTRTRCIWRCAVCVMCAVCLAACLAVCVMCAACLAACLAVCVMCAACFAACLVACLAASAVSSAFAHSPSRCWLLRCCGHIDISLTALFRVFL